MIVTRILISLASVFLALGLVAPTLTITPKAGDYTWLIKIFAPEQLDAITYSIVGVIQKLYQMEDLFLAVLLSIFSVVSPIIKLSLYWIATSSNLGKTQIESNLKKINFIGKFSMAEVFALALIIVVIKSFPGGSSAHLEWGAYIFTLSVIFSLVVALRLDSKRS